MSDTLPTASERASALMDGELRGDEFAQAVQMLCDSPQARQDWDTYHLVGAALRSRSADLRAHDPAFVAHLRDRLALEDGAATPANVPVALPLAQAVTAVPAANDAWWLRVAGVVSVVAVTFGLWQGWFGLGSSAQPGGSTLAQLAAPAQPAASSAVIASQQDATVMLRDPRLDALLAAHRQHGGVTALQMPAGFLRNATYEEGGR